MNQYWKSSFENGRPYAYDKKMVCPNCSKFEGTINSCCYPAVITHPVFLIVKENKKTGQKFLGCPNFPQCKCSADIYSVRINKQKEKIYNIDFEDELRPF